jgi:hypothetical protein
MVYVLKPGRKKNDDISSQLETLNEKFSIWLKLINFKFEIASIDDSFRVYINNKEFKDGSEESGSSRQRVVLAFYAALLETSLVHSGNHPGILIFDGIVQHELDINDLKVYLNALEKLSSVYRKNIQVVVSITSDDIDFNEFKKITIWKPWYKDNNEKLWFLGPLDNNEIKK